MKTLKDTQWSKDGLSRELTDWELIVEAGEANLDPDGDILYVVASMIDGGSSAEQIATYVICAVSNTIEDKAAELRED